MSYPDGPHLAIPFRIDGTSAAVVEDSTLAEIRQNVAAILATTPGERLMTPEFGGPDMMFHNSIDPADIEAAVQLWENRAQLAFGESYVTEGGEFGLTIHVSAEDVVAATDEVGPAPTLRPVVPDPGTGGGGTPQQVGASLNQQWKQYVKANRSLAQSWATRVTGPTPVGRTLDELWNTREVVTESLGLLWSIHTSLLENNFDGGTNGAGISAAGSGGTSGNPFDNTTGPPLYDNTHAHSGTLSMHVAPGSGGLRYVQWAGSFGTNNAWWARFYVYTPAAGAGGNLFFMRGFTGATQNFRLAFTTAAKVRLLNSTNAVVATMTNSSTLNAWVRVEMSITHTTGAWEVRLYNSPESTTPTETISGTGAALGTASDTIDFGHTPSSSPDPGEYWMDDVATSTSGWIGHT